MTMQNFPRGGKKSEKKHVVKPDGPSTSKKKEKRVSKSDTPSQPDQTVLNDARNLHHRVIQPQMNILSRVHKVHKLELIVSLPGFLSAKVSIADISSSYTAILKQIAHDGSVASNDYKRLDELYKPGDYLVCNVLQLLDDAKYICRCSISPSAVNVNVKINSLAVGCVLVCSVSSVEDHGFVMETGLHNVRAFLERKHVLDDSNLFVGKQTTCYIKKIKETDNVYTLSLSTKPKHEDLESQKTQILDNMLPGSKYELTVNRVLPHGVEVVYNEDEKIGYINQVHLPKSLQTYEKGTLLTGTLLYTIQLYKFAFFTSLSFDEDSLKFQLGDIVEEAKMYSKETGGILLKLSKGARGYVTNKRTGVDYLNIDKTFVPHSKHRVRIIGYNCMDRTYVCTMEKKLLDEKYFSKSSLEVGDVLKVVISHISPDNYVEVRFGRIMGVIPPREIRDFNQEFEPQVGQTVEAKVLDLDSKTKVVFTTRQSIVTNDLPVLKKGDVQIGQKCLALVTSLKPNGLKVRVLGGIPGFVPDNFKQAEKMKKKKKYFVNQPIIVSVVEVKENSLVLKEVPENVSEKPKIKIETLPVGSEVEGTVVDATSEGLQVELEKNKLVAFLPSAHVAPCPELGSAICARTKLGTKLTSNVFANFPDVLLNSWIVPSSLSFEKLKVGDVVPCSLVSNEEDNSVTAIVPCDDFFGTAKTVRTFAEVGQSFNHEIRLGLVKKKELKRNQTGIQVYTGFSEVWKTNPSVTVGLDLLTLYLNKVMELSELESVKSSAISRVKIGQKVKGKVTKVTKEGLVVELENNVAGTVKKEHVEGSFKVGQKVEGAVLWVNYVHQLVEVTLVRRLVNVISSRSLERSVVDEGKLMQASILLVNSWFALVHLKGKGKNSIGALPVRLNINDTEPDLSLFDIHKKVRVYGILVQEELDNVPVSVCMLKSSFEENQQVVQDLSRRSSLNGKRKIKNDEEKSAKKMKIEIKEEESDKEERVECEPEDEDELMEESEPEIVEEERVEREMEVDNTAEQVECEPEEDEKMPEIGFCWTDNKIDDVSSDSSSDEETEEPVKKKKKLSSAERREQEREKEREIREREEYLASGTGPNSVDQFDRLVLAQPNSSLVWIQYMTFHLQMAEVEKAKAVARRAVSTINFREEEERLNVWKAWLNLESKFGTEESLKTLVEEAVKMNDAKEIYQHLLTVYAEAGRTIELENLIRLVSGKNGKFKHDPDMWISCGAALLKVELKQKSRMLMQRALQSLPPQQHVNLIVRFAYLENKFGDTERCQTLFEQVLSSYPKRTDIWLSYVDIATKAENIEMARTILQRAISQPIAPKKMKPIFKKYLDFETQYGTPETVSNVKQLAADYVEKQCD